MIQKGVKNRISVVLPIYNVEKYIDRCINSVVKQSYSELEIILVDDGSPDNCPEICDRWMKKDSRIKVVHKENAGLGMARNTGIENATGEYICFFDSDDYIEIDTIEKAYQAAKKYNSEMVVFGYIDVAQNGEIIKTHTPANDELFFSGSDVREKFLPEALNRTKLNINLSAWSCMYSMDIISKSNWRFVSEKEIISEDVYSLLDLYSKVESVVVIPDALYNYCQNEASLTRVFREDRFDKIIDFYKKCEEISIKNKLNSEVIKALSGPFLANAIGAMKILAFSPLEYSKKIGLIKSFLENETTQIVLKLVDMKSQGIKRRVYLFFMKKKVASICLIMTKF